MDEEVGYILDLGVELKGGVKLDSMKKLIEQSYDAIFVGSGAPRGRDLDIPGRKEAAKNIHIGIDWLSSVSFGHTDKIGKRVIVLGGGNTAMDCCRSSKRLGGEDVKVIVRSGFEEMKASPWEKEDAQHEGIPILNYFVPKTFEHANGKLTGMTFEKVKAVRDEKGKRSLVPTGEPDQRFECDDVLIAVGQENAFPWIERDCGIEFDKSGMPIRDKGTIQSSATNIFFESDAECPRAPTTVFRRARRSLTCDAHAVFAANLWLHPHPGLGVCPMESFPSPQGGEKAAIPTRLTAPARNALQDLYVSGPLKT